jgi:hypothetical protein
MYAAATLTGLTAADMVAAPLPAVACVGMAWFAESKFDALETLANDPVDYNFMRISTPIERRFYREELGYSRLERELVAAGDSVLAAAAYLNAFVRAVERRAGAIEREQPQYVSLQGEAMNRFHRESVDLLRSMTDRVDPLARALDEDEDAHAAINAAQRPFSWPETRLDLELSPNALATLYRMGVSIRLLREKIGPTWSPDPINDFTGALRRAATASVMLGDSLETWEPPVSDLPS